MMRKFADDTKLGQEQVFVEDNESLLEKDVWLGQLLTGSESSLSEIKKPDPDPNNM